MYPHNQTNNYNYKPRPLIPEGVYRAMLTRVEWKANKAGTGHYLQCGYVIMEGPYKGHYLADFLNLDNQNEFAKKIAYERFEQLLNATNMVLTTNNHYTLLNEWQRKVIDDPFLLTYIPLAMTVVKKVDQKTHEERNNITKIQDPSFVNFSPALKDYTPKPTLAASQDKGYEIKKPEPEEEEFIDDGIPF